MEKYTFHEGYVIGEKARLSRTISKENIHQMADITGDFNPVHLDEEFASRTQFEGCIAHGVFNFGLISAVLGTKLPGPGAIYLNQTLQFLNPVRAGDTLTAEVEVTSWRTDKRIITLKTCCFNQHHENVAEGEAVLFVEKL
ncbi:MaoC family dehydratase [Pseudomonadota bacterium]